MKQNQPAWIQWQPQSKTLACGGDWSYHSLPAVIKQCRDLLGQLSGSIHLDCQAITTMDTSAGVAIANFIQQCQQRDIALSLNHLAEKQQHLFDLIHQHLPEAKAAEQMKAPNWLYRLGESTANKWQVGHAFLSFIGELFYRLLVTLKQPRRFRFAYLANIMQDSGLYALPLIAFLSLLVGVVLAYQIGLQLRLYGANIFVVNLLSLSVLREFGPLMTAIIVAGRSGSAFTAQIGTMVVRQEVDALETMGLRPFDLLVLPRVLALMITLPLLTVWADCFAMLGGMLMSKSMLGIGFYEFLHRARTDVPLDNYLIGLIKTPMFGLVIAAVGCFQGFKVSGSAASVGHQTTKSVVQALFLIIILDAIFSVIFSVNGF